jgi:hypothetical protein
MTTYKQRFTQAELYNQRERSAEINACMEADLLAEAKSHLAMRERTRAEAKAFKRSTLKPWPTH